jgi:hypothetical protein
LQLYPAGINTRALLHSSAGTVIFGAANPMPGLVAVLAAGTEQGYPCQPQPRAPSRNMLLSSEHLTLNSLNYQMGMVPLKILPQKIWRFQYSSRFIVSSPFVHPPSNPDGDEFLDIRCSRRVL